MKKTLILFILFFTVSIKPSYAVINCCAQACPAATQFATSCTDEEICACEDIITENSTTHILTVQEGNQMFNCKAGIASVSCLRNIPKYKCESGYYGTPLNASSGCTKCPSPGTSAQGATSITQCYIPANTSLSDTTGSYTYTSDCYYSN